MKPEGKTDSDTGGRGLYNRTSQKVNEMLGNINTSSALAAFDKMEEKGKYDLWCCKVNAY